MKRFNALFCLLVASLSACTGRNAKRSDDSNTLFLYPQSDNNLIEHKTLHTSHASHYSAQVTFRHNVIKSSKKRIELNERQISEIKLIISQHHTTGKEKCICNRVGIDLYDVESIDSININKSCYYLNYYIDIYKDTGQNTSIHSSQCFEYYIAQDRSKFYRYDILLNSNSPSGQVKNEQWITRILDVIENEL